MNKSIFIFLIIFFTSSIILAETTNKEIKENKKIILSTFNPTMISFGGGYNFNENYKEIYLKKEVSGELLELDLNHTFFMKNWKYLFLTGGLRLRFRFKYGGSAPVAPAIIIPKINFIITNNKEKDNYFSFLNIELSHNTNALRENPELYFYTSAVETSINLVNLYDENPKLGCKYSIFPWFLPKTFKIALKYYFNKEKKLSENNYEDFKFYIKLSNFSKLESQEKKFTNNKFNYLFNFGIINKKTKDFKDTIYGNLTLFFRIPWKALNELSFFVKYENQYDYMHINYEQRLDKISFGISSNPFDIFQKNYNTTKEAQ